METIRDSAANAAGNDVGIELQSRPTSMSTTIGNSPDSRFVIGSIVFLTYAAFGMAYAACGSFLKEIMAEMHLSLSEASFLTTSVSIAKIVSSVLAGFVLVRLGLRWAFMMAAALLCLGIFAAAATHYPLLLLARFSMGVGAAMVVVYFAPITVAWFPQKERVIVNGLLNGISGNTGVMISLFATPLLMRAFGGSWRLTLALYSTASIVIALFWLFLGSEKGNTTLHDKPVRVGNRDGFMSVARDVNTWKISLAFAGALTTYLALFTYFPTYYSHVLGYGFGTAVSYAPGISMGAGIAGTISGILAGNKLDRRLPLLRYPGLLFTAAIVGMVVFRSPLLIILSAVAAGFLLQLATPAIFTIPQELPGQAKENVAYVMGIFWSTSYGVATLWLWIVGKVIETTGSYVYGLLLVAAASSSLCLMSFVLPETVARKNTVGPISSCE